MPNPKRRHSKSRSRKRRTHDALKTTNLTACPNCGTNKLPHRVCASCGFYGSGERGRVVLEKEL